MVMAESGRLVFVVVTGVKDVCLNTRKRDVFEA
jgi:hypothetical protein